MMLIKPQFWDKKIGFISIILIPLTIIYFFIIFFKKKLTRTKTFRIPIVCVGNIYLGGTGKTPTSILLANEIKRSGKNVGILRRYHKTHLDEYNLIKSKFTNLILNNNRVQGIKEAEKSNFDIIILDDGLQDHRIKKNLTIVCFNENQLIGNGLILPSGPLRENLSNLKDADIIIINGNKNNNFEEKILNINNKLEIFYSKYKPTNIDQFKDKKLLAITGIGNPENFLKLMKENNLAVKKKLIFPDHYEFSKKEIQNIKDEADKENYQIIMTEKDYFKIKNFEIKNIEYLKISLELDNKDKILNKIKKLYDKNN